MGNLDDNFTDNKNEVKPDDLQPEDMKLPEDLELDTEDNNAEDDTGEGVDDSAYEGDDDLPDNDKDAGNYLLVCCSNYDEAGDSDVNVGGEVGEKMVKLGMMMVTFGIGMVKLKLIIVKLGIVDSVGDGAANVKHSDNEIGNDMVELKMMILKLEIAMVKLKMMIVKL